MDAADGLLAIKEIFIEFAGLAKFILLCIYLELVLLPSGVNSAKNLSRTAMSIVVEVPAVSVTNVPYTSIRLETPSVWVIFFTTQFPLLAAFDASVTTIYCPGLITEVANA